MEQSQVERARLTPEFRQTLKGPDEGLLDVVLGPVEVSRHTVRQTEHPAHVRVIQGALGAGVARQYSADQFSVVHRLQTREGRER